MLKSLNHCKYDLSYHLILTSKYRRKVFVNPFKDYLYNVIKEIIANSNLELFNLNGTSDHLHILLEIPPSRAISEVVRVIKANLSRLAFVNYLAYLRKFYWSRNYLFSSGAFISTVGANLDIVENYVRNQGSN